MIKKICIYSLIVIALLLSACELESDLPPFSDPSDIVDAEQEDELRPENFPDEQTNETDQTDEDTIDQQSSAEVQPAGPVLDPDPQDVTFQASDGWTLQGRYYPAAVTPAPLVVLFHWVGGDMTDWNEIATWLQNRGLQNPYPNPGQEDWWRSTWFPPMTEGASYAVFIVTLRGCQPYPDGCSAWTPDEWLLDAQMAMLMARLQAGVDPTRIVAVGASIGGDAAIDSCYWLNEQFPGSCQGAASLGPGGYLNIPYPSAVEKLDVEQPAKSAWCLIDPLNETDYYFCGGLTNENFTLRQFPNGGHGMNLFREQVDPSAMEALLEFVSSTIGP